jgi:magnesium-transporting ATPase (P-type)
LYGNEDFTSTKTPPLDYTPSSADIYLAHVIAASSKTLHLLLPPPSMPTAGPILGLTASIFAYVGLTYLIPHWSTRFRVFLDYCRTDSLSPESTKTKTSKSDTTERRQLEESVLVRIPESVGHVSSSPRSKSNEKYLIRPLYQATTKSKKSDKANESASTLLLDSFAHPLPYFFEVSQSRVYCDTLTKTWVDGAPTLQNMPLLQLQTLIQNGGLSRRQRKVAQERYKPYNTFDLTPPTIRNAFLSRISSPLVVIQFLGKVMSVVEEGKGALFSLVVSLMEHYWDARRAIQSAEQMAQDVKTNLQDTSGCKVLVYRSENDEWIEAVASDLVPGDMFRLGCVPSHETNQNNSTDDLIVPVDALVLEGQCLTNEAILTGESVSQVKVPLDLPSDMSSDVSSQSTLDLYADRSSILFAGTTLLRHGLNTQMSKDSDGMMCLALRTGTYSSKGQLVRALKGTENVVGVSNVQADRDAMRLIAAMTLFAGISCASLFVRRDGKVAIVSPFRRVVQCTHIVLASIPSSLPLALAAVARTCSRMLRIRSDVVCSEPGSLLTAAYVDTVVFDKVRFVVMAQ